MTANPQRSQGTTNRNSAQSRLISSSSLRPARQNQRNPNVPQDRPDPTGSSLAQEQVLSFEHSDELNEGMQDQFYFFENAPDSRMSLPLAESGLMNREELKRIQKKRIGKSSSHCTVCYDQYAKGEVIRVLPCGHFFHYKCLKPWFKKSSLCPLCRLNVKKALQENQNPVDPTSIYIPNINV